MKYYAVIVAGGSGQRMGSEIPKQFIPLAGKPILMHTLEAFAQAEKQPEIILVLPASQQKYWKDCCQQHGFTLGHKVVNGGNSRFQSVKAGLDAIPKKEENLVAIHDGVRPLISFEKITAAYQQAKHDESAIMAVRLKDSIRYQKNPEQTEALDRSKYWLVQTPQVFKTSLIWQAYQQPERADFTDCASVAEAAGHSIKLIEGSYRNIKVTTPEDLIIAEALITAPARD